MSCDACNLAFDDVADGADFDPFDLEHVADVARAHAADADEADADGVDGRDRSAAQAARQVSPRQRMLRCPIRSSPGRVPLAHKPQKIAAMAAGYRSRAYSCPSRDLLPSASGAMPSHHVARNCRGELALIQAC